MAMEIEIKINSFELLKLFAFPGCDVVVVVVNACVLLVVGLFVDDDDEVDVLTDVLVVGSGVDGLA